MSAPRTPSESARLKILEPKMGKLLKLTPRGKHRSKEGIRTDAQTPVALSGTSSHTTMRANAQNGPSTPESARHEDTLNQKCANCSTHIGSQKGLSGSRFAQRRCGTLA